MNREFLRTYRNVAGGKPNCRRCTAQLRGIPVQSLAKVSSSGCRPCKIDSTMVAYEFVEFIPDDLKEQTLYISIAYCTAVHKCCCGCGREVVTSLSPTAWKLILDGKTVSLYPSIGSWNLPCQSHYQGSLGTKVDEGADHQGSGAGSEGEGQILY